MTPPSLPGENGIPFVSLGDETLLVRELTQQRSPMIGQLPLRPSRWSVECGYSPYVKTVLRDVAVQLLRQAELMRALQIPVHDTIMDAADYVERLCLAVSRSRLDTMNIHLVFAADFPAD